MLAPGRWSKRTRKVMQGSVLIPSYGRSSRFGQEADHLIAPPTDSNAKMASVFAGHRLGGAPRRNRTGDPILTMEPPGTAVRTAVSPGDARPSGPKLSVLLWRSYAFWFCRNLEAKCPLRVRLAVSRLAAGSISVRRSVASELLPCRPPLLTPWDRSWLWCHHSQQPTPSRIGSAQVSAR